MRGGNFGFAFCAAVSICFCLTSSHSEENGKNRQTYVIRYKDGEQTIPVTVVLDYKKQTEYVINMNPRTPAKSVTLYDFKQRTIAYKDLTNRECFLGRLTYETLNEENHALRDLKNPVEVRPKIRSLDPKMPALTPTEIRNIAGQKTAVFCRKMNTWLLMPEKTHSISKREADEYEERTYQHHGHQSSQYSHYERETRRRYRNRSQAASTHRSQIKESEAENENGRLPNPVSTATLPFSNIQSSNGTYSNPRHLNIFSGANLQNQSTSYHGPQNPYPLNQLNDNKKDTRPTYTQRLPFRATNLSQNLRHPNSETRIVSSGGDHIYSRPALNRLHNINSNATDENSAFDHEITSPENLRNTSKEQHSEGIFLEKLTLDGTHSIGERSTTTDIPYPPYGQVGYSNVHSSLAHLLPLYKPLREEFDFDQETGSENHLPDQPRNIESEGPALPTPFAILNPLAGINDTFHDPDVSINVLEIPRITKEFENIKGNETYIPISQSGNTEHFPNSANSYPLSTQTRVHSTNSLNFQRNNLHGREDSRFQEHLPLSPNRNINNIAKETNFNDHRFYVPHQEIVTTTEFPVLTTPEYPTDKRTTPNFKYIPPVHTVLKNSEDTDSFRIYPNYIENDITPVNERNSSVHSTPIEKYKFRNENSRKIPQYLVSTTEYPSTEEKHRTIVNHRSDIPSEDNSDQSPPIHTVPDVNRNSHSPVHNNTTGEAVSQHKIRYQSALRDFKPDEIVIDIGNVPTHTPSPVTSGFQQKLPTTIQPTIKSLPSINIRSDADRHSAQAWGTTRHNAYPTTRYPRRRVNNKFRRPVQNTSIPSSQRGPSNHNRYQAPRHPVQIDKRVGVNHFIPSHHTNRQQFYYPNRPIPPSRVHIPGELNQIHLIADLSNLPPGVSVHPRHPQAPFADMIHSNRPPTIPVVDENLEFPKPHRQRHHRKKERHMNSCCRLRGQSSAFQSCCRNGGPCCSRSQRRMQSPGAPCCSPTNANGQSISSNQIQQPVRTTNQILPPIRTEKTHRSEPDNKDRCQKEKMCRTLYESTQQVMVCRNADIEGC